MDDAIKHRLLFSTSFPEDLEDIAQCLGENAIPFKIEKEQPAFDPAFAFNQASGALQLWVEDEIYAEAHQLLEKEGFLEPEPEDPMRQFFADFSDEDLQDVMVKMEEWEPEQVEMARTLLIEREVEIDPDEIRAERKKFVAEVRTPRRVSTLLLILTLLFTIGGGLLGVIMAVLIAVGMGKDPEGKIYFYYDMPSRVVAWLIVGFGLIWFFFIFYPIFQDFGGFSFLPF